MTVPSLLLKLSILSALLLGLPLLGIVISGEAVTSYLEFPPQTRDVTPAPFSWLIFIGTALLAVLLFLTIGWLMLRGLRHHPSRILHTGKWPWWGWLGLVTLTMSWILAWNRFAWFSEWQWATFTPLWLSYIVVINAGTLRRSGRCLLQHRPRYFLSLFPLSALFWWYFEYLNRFVQNWYYQGTEEFSAARYIIHASLAFSTVLPAVMSTKEWLATLLRPAAGAVAITLPERTARNTSIITLIIAAAGLLALGVWPDYLFPLLWVAPLLLLLAIQGLSAEPPLLQQLRTQGWQVIYLPALAALQCGFVWEMWNMYSEAKWIYNIPFVHGLQIFEMPLLGYTGYLPFGIECAVIALLVEEDKRQ